MAVTSTGTTPRAFGELYPGLTSRPVMIERQAQVVTRSVRVEKWPMSRIVVTEMRAVDAWMRWMNWEERCLLKWVQSKESKDEAEKVQLSSSSSST